MKIALCLFAFMLLVACVASISVQRLSPHSKVKLVVDSEFGSEFDLVFGPFDGNNSSACFKNSSDRGVGTIPDSCPAGQEKNGALCYPLCKANYTGAGPVCWQDCPSGYTDTGAFCQPNSQWGNNDNCPLYDKCGLIYNSAKGCVICPEGMSASGCICEAPGKLFAKDSYGRGAGYLMQCADGLEEQAGLCYPPCPAGSDGVGPVCWETCHGNYSYDCGGAICTPESQNCTDKYLGMAQSLVKLEIQLAECVLANEQKSIRRNNWMQKRQMVKELMSEQPGDKQTEEGEEEEKDEKDAVVHRLFKFFRETFMTEHHGSDHSKGHFHHDHHDQDHHDQDHHSFAPMCDPKAIATQIANIIHLLNLPTCAV